jgi:hypothetical protein
MKKFSSTLFQKFEESELSSEMNQLVLGGLQYTRIENQGGLVTWDVINDGSTTAEGSTKDKDSHPLMTGE